VKASEVWTDLRIDAPADYPRSSVTQPSAQHCSVASDSACCIPQARHNTHDSLAGLKQDYLVANDY